MSDCYPRYEKIDSCTIKIITEKKDDVPISKLLENKKLITEKIEQMQATLKAINEILAEADKMGIVAEVKIDPDDTHPTGDKGYTGMSREL